VAYNSIANPNQIFSQIPTLNNLQSIDLSGLGISSLNSSSFQNWNQLRYIYLDDNKLTKIGSGAFQAVPNLYVITCSSNLITELDKFVGAEELTFVNFSNNKISKIGPETFANALNPYVIDIYLDQNQLINIMIQKCLISFCK